MISPLEKKECCHNFENSLLDSLTKESFYVNQISHIEVISARAVSFGTLNCPLKSLGLEDNLRNVLGIKQFYSHQAKGIDAIREGQHLVLSTSTASGKSIVYNVPIIEAIVLNPGTKALYLFPTKVLYDLKPIFVLYQHSFAHDRIGSGPGSIKSINRISNR
jgi:ATP-dependent helicase YprA (DUF1998 family)